MNGLVFRLIHIKDRSVEDSIDLEHLTSSICLRPHRGVAVHSDPAVSLQVTLIHAVLVIVQIQIHSQMRGVLLTGHEHVLDLELTIDLIAVLASAWAQTKIAGNNNIVLITSQSRLQILNHVPLGDELLTLAQIHRELLSTGDSLDHILIQTIIPCNIDIIAINITGLDFIVLEAAQGNVAHIGAGLNAKIDANLLAFIKGVALHHRSLPRNGNLTAKIKARINVILLICHM